ncbi:hypothetical protein VP1G_07177 [Cytospora mali]|uniref:Uncharacterized protein n=1 Tax=Cytospora mali TaxID=578113 RepID=A0A194V7Y4_CYTMA|nr:hypothetical protein VP1G_07177 [Valsa mali var. pyri (nom. inval.)]
MAPIRTIQNYADGGPLPKRARTDEGGPCGRCDEGVQGSLEARVDRLSANPFAYIPPPAARNGRPFNNRHLDPIDFTTGTGSTAVGGAGKTNTTGKQAGGQPKTPASSLPSTEPPGTQAPRSFRKPVAVTKVTGQQSGGKPRTPAKRVPDPTPPVAKEPSSLRKSTATSNVTSRQYKEQPQITPSPQTSSSLQAGSQASQSGRREDRILAEARAETECKLKVPDESGEISYEDVTLRLRLRVHTCDVPFETRLGYSAKIVLRRRGRPDLDIGSIHGWRVSKPCAAHPNIDPQYFIKDWFKTSLSRFPDNQGWNELAQALRAIYTQAGRPRARISDRLRRTLEDGGSELVFIQMLHVLWADDEGLEFQGNGFGRLALDMYYRILTSHLLPSWYRVQTPATFLLVPGLPADPTEGGRWDITRPAGESDGDLATRVAKELAKMYQKWMYEIYVRNARVRTAQPGVDNMETVMGRTFDRPVPSAPRDRLRRVKNPIASSSLASSVSSTPMRHPRVPSKEVAGDEDEDDAA